MLDVYNIDDARLEQMESNTLIGATVERVSEEMGAVTQIALRLKDGRLIFIEGWGDECMCAFLDSDGGEA